MQRIAIFDVDHTITHRSTGRRFAQYGRQVGFFRLRDLVTLPLIYTLYRLGNMAPDFLYREFDPLRGKTESDIEKVAEGCFQRYVHRDMYPEALAIVRDHLDRGDTVVLASTSLDVLVNRVAKFLGVQSVIASRLEYRDGLSTGRTQGRPCFGEEKRRRALSYIESVGLTAADAVFYSDSIHDQPLLEIIGTPIPVNPDYKLRRLAKERGWNTLSFSPPRGR